MELNSLFWSQVKSTIKSNNGANKLLENWLDPIDLIKTEKAGDAIKITFGVPTKFFLYYVNEHLKEKIATELALQSDMKLEIDYVVTGHAATDYNASLQDVMQNSERLFQPVAPAAYVAQPKAIENVNEDFTFSTFVVGKNSEFAHAATYNVASNPGCVRQR